MDPSDDATFDEEAELQAFNDPFDAVSENFVRRRHAQREEQALSPEDEQKLLTLIDAHDLEGRVLQDACSRMAMMNLVSQEVLSQVQDDFEFEKVCLCPFRPFSLTFAINSATFMPYHSLVPLFAQILTRNSSLLSRKCNSWISPPLLLLQPKSFNK